LEFYGADRGAFASREAAKVKREPDLSLAPNQISGNKKASF
jgi:hypothetical protein